MYSTVRISWQRRYAVAGACWLMTISIDTSHGHAGGGNLFAAYPQADAVVNDFGDLVAVTNWDLKA